MEEALNPREGLAESPASSPSTSVLDLDDRRAFGVWGGIGGGDGRGLGVGATHGGDGKGRDFGVGGAHGGGDCGRRREEDEYASGDLHAVQGCGGDAPGITHGGSSGFGGGTDSAQGEDPARDHRLGDDGGQIRRSGGRVVETLRTAPLGFVWPNLGWCGGGGHDGEVAATQSGDARRARRRGVGGAEAEGGPGGFTAAASLSSVSPTFCTNPGACTERHQRVGVSRAGSRFWLLASEESDDPATVLLLRFPIKKGNQRVLTPGAKAMKQLAGEAYSCIAGVVSSWGFEDRWLNFLESLHLWRGTRLLCWPCFCMR